jgi:hypothetical protein
MDQRRPAPTQSHTFLHLKPAPPLPGCPHACPSRSLRAEGSSSTPGEGIIATVAGRTVGVGSARMARSLIRKACSGAADSAGDAAASDASDAWQAAQVDAAVQEWGGCGASTAFVLVDGRLAGFIAVRDQPRHTVRKDHALGPTPWDAISPPPLPHLLATHHLLPTFSCYPACLHDPFKSHTRARTHTKLAAPSSHQAWQLTFALTLT